MARKKKEKEFVVETNAAKAGAVDESAERVNKCIDEIEAALRRYNCVLDHYYIIHGTKIIPQLKVVPLPPDAQVPTQQN